MIFGSKRSVAALLLYMLSGWLIGCGPKPATLIVEPPQPREPIAVIEPDPVNETNTENGSVRIDLPHEEPDPDPATVQAHVTEVQAPPLLHKVRWGHETLYTIALWYTGKGSNWRRLAAANPDIKPRRMRIGDTIRIPDALLTKRRPMPANYLRPAPKPKPNQVKKPPSQPAPQPVEPIEAPPLYGPVEQAPALYGPVGDEPQVSPDERSDLPVPLEPIRE